MLVSQRLHYHDRDNTSFVVRASKSDKGVGRRGRIPITNDRY